MSAFETWIEWIKDEKGTERYTAEERRLSFEVLADLLFTNGVSIECALAFKPKIVKMFVTKEGYKNQGKYNGWTKQVEKDFKSIVEVRYGLAKDAPRWNLSQIKEETDQSDTLYLEASRPMIVQWLTHYFKITPGESIIDEACRPNSTLNRLFQEDVLLSETLEDDDTYLELLFDAEQKLDDYE